MNALDEGKLLVVVEHLSIAVVKLTAAVERLEARQNYAAGALAGIGLVSAAIGGITATLLQWFHK